MPDEQHNPSGGQQVEPEAEGMAASVATATRATVATATRGTRAKSGTSKKASSSKTGKAGKAGTAGTDKTSSDDDLTPQIIAEALGVQPGLQGGKPRQTLPTNANVLGVLPWAFLPRRNYQDVDLSTLQANTLSAQQLVELLADSWPEASLALWNFLRLGTLGWSYEVRSPDDTREDAEGKADLDRIVARVNAEWGGFDAILEQWFMSVVLQGACGGETVPNEAVDDVDDIVAVQPWTVYFQRDLDQKYVPYQWQPMLASGGAAFYGSGVQGQTGIGQGYQGTVPDYTAKAPPPASLLLQNALNHGGFRLLNTLTFGYVGLDAPADDPYGRSPFAPVLQLVAWDAQIIKDLRQWSHVNAFGRIDVTILAEAAIKLMPPNIATNAAERTKFLTQYLGDITSAYNQLNPDDTFVHYDAVQVKGHDSSGKTFQIDGLIRVLERRIFRALKQLPILMGSNEGTTETWGSVQMRVYAAGIASLQRVVASLAEKLLTVSLRIRGRTSVVKFKFDTLLAADRLAEAQAESIEIRNAAAKRDQGWITQDDASIEVTGSKSVADAPQPDMLVAVNMPDQGADKPLVQQGAPGTNAPGSEGNPDDTEPPPPGGKGKGKQKPSKPNDQEGEQGSEGEGDEGDDEQGKGSSKTRARGRLVTRMAAPVATRAAIGPEVSNTGKGHTGAMLAFYLDRDAAEQLAIPGGEAPDELHLTLGYLGEASDLEDPESIKAAVADTMANYRAFHGTVGGLGRFMPEEGAHPVYASADVPGLAAFRTELVQAVNKVAEQGGVHTEHDFTPHITLAYVDPEAPMPVESVPAVDLHFNRLTLALGDEHTTWHFEEAASEGEGRSTTTPAPLAPRPTLRQENALQGHTDRKPLAFPANGDEGEGDDVGDLATGATGDKHTTAGHRGVSHKRASLTRRMENDMRAALLSSKPSEHLLAHVIATHRSSATRNWRGTWPPLAEAIDVILAAEAAPTDLATRAAIASGAQPPLVFTRLTDDQRKALLASIARMLEADIPDSDEGLADLLDQYAQEAYNLGGQEALDHVKLDGQFSLTNRALLVALSHKARSTVHGLQQTTRDLLASTIAEGLVEGHTGAEIGAAVGERVASMAAYRASTIASTQVATDYYDASGQTWQRNGWTHKVWQTGDDPDPGSKRSVPCQDNAYAGAIPMYDVFPGGVWAPPQHPNCICDLVPAGEPSEPALTVPWTGA